MKKIIEGIHPSGAKAEIFIREDSGTYQLWCISPNGIGTHNDWYMTLEQAKQEARCNSFTVFDLQKGLNKGKWKWNKVNS